MIRLKSTLLRKLTLKDKRIVFLSMSKLIDQQLLWEAVCNDSGCESPLLKLLDTLDLLFSQLTMVQSENVFEDLVGLISNLERIKSRNLYLGIVMSYVERERLNFDEVSSVIGRLTFAGRLSELEQVFMSISKKID